MYRSKEKLGAELEYWSDAAGNPDASKGPLPVELEHSKKKFPVDAAGSHSSYLSSYKGNFRVAFINRSEKTGAGDRTSTPLKEPIRAYRPQNGRTPCTQ